MTTFSKILVARHSPKNKCFAEDGAVLFVTPLGKVPLKEEIRHYFVSTGDRATKAQYGWVAEAQPFSVDDFIRDHLSGDSVDEAQRTHLDVMFRSIEKLSPGTPVATDYVGRGLGNTHMEFTVHRVFFYKA